MDTRLTAQARRHRPDDRPPPSSPAARVLREAQADPIEEHWVGVRKVAGRYMRYEAVERLPSGEVRVLSPDPEPHVHAAARAGGRLVDLGTREQGMPVDDWPRDDPSAE